MKYQPDIMESMALVAQQQGIVNLLRSSQPTSDELIAAMLKDHRAEEDAE